VYGLFGLWDKGKPIQSLLLNRGYRFALPKDGFWLPPLAMRHSL